MATPYLINPRVRAYGKARIDMSHRLKEPGDWEKLWLPPSHPFPFSWGQPWKHCVEYKVDDYPAEVGFFIDLLGLQVNAFDDNYAMFTSPQGDFYLAVVPAHADHPATPPDALRLQFMLADILSTTTELEKRGIVFDQPPQAIQPGSSLYISTFHTPHGIRVDLWGTIVTEPVPAAEISLSFQDNDEDDDLLEDDEDEEPLEGDKILQDDEGEPIEDEDTDVDETGVQIDDQDEDEDEELIFDEGIDENEDEENELLEYEDDDLEDDEDIELDEDDFDDDK